jgi:hypothetical protein
MLSGGRLYLKLDIRSELGYYGSLRNERTILFYWEMAEVDAKYTIRMDYEGVCL